MNRARFYLLDLHLLCRKLFAVVLSISFFISPFQVAIVHESAVPDAHAPAAFIGGYIDTTVPSARVLVRKQQMARRVIRVPATDTAARNHPWRQWKSAMSLTEMQ